MANTNLAVRFTDEVYASRSDVAKSLGTNLIDSIWLQILNYRKSYSTALSLKDINKVPYTVTLTNAVIEKTQALDSRFEDVFNEYGTLENGSIEKETLRREMIRNSLKHIAKVRNIIINDVALDNIIANRSSDLLYQPLVRYYEALKVIENSNNIIINDTSIARFLEILEGGELTSFYRTKEISMPSQRVLINREVKGAPTNQIEGMMENLLDFINDPNANLSIKIAGISYSMNYILPFENYNEEMASLLIRCLIQSNHKVPASVIIPFEILHIDSRGALALCSKEAQKSNDLTYYVNESNRMIDETLTFVLDRAVTVSRDETERAYFSEEPEPVKVEPMVQPIKEEVKLQPKPAFEPANNNPKVNVHVFKDLDEKALRRAAEDLLESDPTLRPGQAHFYVRHCTLGKYYTIQQYKQAEHCVYETARTSMDNLARAGYYRREQVKNKFVYTPISKE